MKAQLDGSDFSNVNALQANFLEATLKNARFEGADIRQTIWTDANLEGADFTDCNLESSNFENAFLKKSKLRNAKIGFGNFAGADLTDAQLVNCDLYMAILDRIIDDNTDWSQSNKRRAQRPDHDKNEAEEWPTARR